MISPEPQSRVLRQVTGDQDKALRIFETLRYASVSDITISDGQIRRMKITISVDLADPESFRKTVEELKTIQL